MSEKFGSADEVLDFAIAKEEEASRFYLELAGRADEPRMKKIFEVFAGEEQVHKRKLLAVKAGKALKPAPGKVMDLKIADYIIAVEPSKKMTFQEALIVVMQREKASFRLYTDLAEGAADEGLRATFEALAQEEAKHKLRFELEYDKRVLQGN